MTSWSWLTGHVIPSAPRVFAREAGARLRETRRRWWRTMPPRVRLAILLAWLLLAGPWLLPAYLRYVNHAWETTWAASERSSLVNWLAPKR